MTLEWDSEKMTPGLTDIDEEHKEWTASDICSIDVQLRNVAGGS